MARQPKTAVVKPTPRKRASRGVPITRVRVAKLEGDDFGPFAKAFESMFPGLIGLTQRTDLGTSSDFHSFHNVAHVPMGGEAIHRDREQGSIQRVRNTLGMCHGIVTQMEDLAGRVLGTQPTTNKPSDKPTSEGEVNVVSEMAQALLERMIAVNARLSELSPSE